MNTIFAKANQYYQQWMPPQLARQIEIVGKDIKYCLEKIYVGRAADRFDGEGDPFLRQKCFYTASNPWDLAKSLLIYAIIATVGALIGSFLGFVLIGGAMLFAAADLKEYSGGNHLLTALSKIVPAMDSLKSLEYHWNDTRNIIVDPADVTEAVMRGCDTEGKTVFLAFKIPKKEGSVSLKLYYFGSERFVRKYVKGINITIDSNNILYGTDIQKLLTIANKSNK